MRRFVERRARRRRARRLRRTSYANVPRLDLSHSVAPRPVHSPLDIATPSPRACSPLYLDQERVGA